jgi:hypothetical protein
MRLVEHLLECSFVGDEEGEEVLEPLDVRLLRCFIFFLGQIVPPVAFWNLILDGNVVVANLHLCLTCPLSLSERNFSIRCDERRILSCTALLRFCTFGSEVTCDQGNGSDARQDVFGTRHMVLDKYPVDAGAVE